MAEKPVTKIQVAGSTKRIGTETTDLNTVDGTIKTSASSTQTLTDYLKDNMLKVEVDNHVLSITKLH